MTTETTTETTSAAIDADAPLRLSHLAYVTHDTGATVDFYTRVMRMPLIEAVMHERVPSTGDEYPYVHFFFRMQDGSTIAFFEAIGLPERTEPSHPAYHTFDHLALEVESTAEVDDWAEWLTSQGLEVLGPVDHKIIYSIYFHDPNGIRLEITTPLEPDWNDRPEEATRIVESFLQAKADARASNRPVSDVLCEVIAANDRRDRSA